MSNRSTGVGLQLPHQVVPLFAVMILAGCSSALRSSDIELGAEADAGEAPGGDGDGGVDCPGSVDDSSPSLAFYRDSDGDGYGNPNVMSLRCSAGGGYIANNTDCNDGDGTSYPGNPEVCDGADNNCNGSADEGINPFCSNNTTLQVCSGGSVSQHDCAASTGSCVSTINGDGTSTGACWGTCVDAATRCESNTQPQTCDLGSWDNETACSFPTQRCDLSNGTHRCVDNPLETLGESTARGNVVDLSDDVLYMQPITLSWDATLEQLGMRTPPSHSGGRAYLALYADDGSGPSALINRTAELWPILTNSSNGRDPSWLKDSSVDLDANTKYWIVAYINVATGNTVRLYNDLNGGVNGPYRTADRAYRSPLSSISGLSTFDNAGDISLWIQVRRR